MLRAYCATWSGEAGDVPQLSREEAHHLAVVRRLRKGEAFEVLNGRGAIGRCVATSIQRRSLEVALEDVRMVAALAPAVELLIALPKAKVFSSLLARMTELGVAAIRPLQTRHAEREHGDPASRMERWQGILIEALKQSGNPWLPQLHEPQALAEALAETSGSLRLCAALQADALAPGAVIREACEAAAVAICVGPEGDFHADEYAQLRNAGCRMVSLGDLVLRVETAATVLLGALRLS
jgi:16S rRNA (uracil1498-N3)-methyltransferase